MRTAILILLLTGCAPTREGTYAAHGADVASTGVGLALIGSPYRLGPSVDLSTHSAQYR